MRQQAYAKMHQAILEGHFQPGERLYEQKLCDLLGVSRTAVREALRQLEGEGLVNLIANKGPVVTELTQDDARDIYQVRETMEGLAASLFAMRGDEAPLAELEETVDRLEECLKQGDSSCLLKIKNDFYEVLSRGCGNLVVHSVLQSLLARVTLLRATSLCQPDRPPQSLIEIKKIVAAIRARDPRAARQASEEHVRQAATVAIKQLSKTAQTDDV